MITETVSKSDSRGEGSTPAQCSTEKAQAQLERAADSLKQVCLRAERIVSEALKQTFLNSSLLIDPQCVPMCAALLLYGFAESQRGTELRLSPEQIVDRLKSVVTVPRSTAEKIGSFLEVLEQSGLVVEKAGSYRLSSSESLGKEDTVGTILHTVHAVREQLGTYWHESTSLREQIIIQQQALNSRAAITRETSPIERVVSKAVESTQEPLQEQSVGRSLRVFSLENYVAEVIRQTVHDLESSVNAVSAVIKGEGTNFKRVSFFKSHGENWARALTREEVDVIFSEMLQSTNANCAQFDMKKLRALFFTSSGASEQLSMAELRYAQEIVTSSSSPLGAKERRRYQDKISELVKQWSDSKDRALKEFKFNFDAVVDNSLALESILSLALPIIGPEGETALDCIKSFHRKAQSTGPYYFEFKDGWESLYSMCDLVNNWEDLRESELLPLHKVIRKVEFDLRMCVKETEQEALIDALAARFESVNETTIFHTGQIRTIASMLSQVGNDYLSYRVPREARGSFLTLTSPETAPELHDIWKLNLDTPVLYPQPRTEQALRAFELVEKCYEEFGKDSIGQPVPHSLAFFAQVLSAVFKEAKYYDHGLAGRAREDLLVTFMLSPVCPFTSAESLLKISHRMERLHERVLSLTKVIGARIGLEIEGFLSSDLDDRLSEDSHQNHAHASGYRPPTPQDYRDVKREGLKNALEVLNAEKEKLLVDLGEGVTQLSACARVAEWIEALRDFHHAEKPIDVDFEKLSQALRLLKMPIDKHLNSPEMLSKSSHSKDFIPSATVIVKSRRSGISAELGSFDTVSKISRALSIQGEKLVPIINTLGELEDIFRFTARRGSWLQWLGYEERAAQYHDLNDLQALLHKHLSKASSSVKNSVLEFSVEQFLFLAHHLSTIERLGQRVLEEYEGDEMLKPLRLAVHPRTLKRQRDVVDAESQNLIAALDDMSFYFHRHCRRWDQTEKAHFFSGTGDFSTLSREEQRVIAGFSTVLATIERAFDSWNERVGRIWLPRDVERVLEKTKGMNQAHGDPVTQGARLLSLIRVSFDLELISDDLIFENRTVIELLRVRRQEMLSHLKGVTSDTEIYV
jgi:hypothetical protein